MALFIGQRLPLTAVLVQPKIWRGAPAPVDRPVEGPHVALVERAYHQSDRQCNDCAVMRSVIPRRTCYHTDTDRPSPHRHRSVASNAARSNYR